MPRVETPAKSGFAELVVRNRRFLEKNTDYKELEGGQHPDFIVIACSDSRVTLPIVMDSGLGSMFEIRTAGGVVDEAALASIEYAVEHLGTEKLLIMVHTNCGADTEAQKLLRISIAGKEIRVESALDHLAYGIYRNIAGNPDNEVDLRNAVIDNAKAQREALLKSTALKEAYQEGKLEIAIGLYDVSTGELVIL